MELGEERFHPGASALTRAEPFGHGETWAGWPLGKPLECKRTFFLFSFPSGLSWAGFTPAVM